MPDQIVSAGGQAVIEGVLIRTRKKISIAVRNPRGRIIVQKRKFTSLLQRNALLRLPLVRGVITLFEMLVVGIKALSFSANIALGEKEQEIGWTELVVSLVLVFGFALLFFKYLPLVLTQSLTKKSALLQESAIAFSVVEGFLKLLLFVGYLVCISFAKDVKTLFRYHGAEHMAVHCFEHKLVLTKNNVKKFAPMHPRCGTSFILFVFLVSIVVYAFIPGTLPLWKKYVYRILLLPLIAGISYELLKVSARLEQNPFFRAITLPGIWLQYITTKQPNTKQIEVAIAALKGALK